MQLQSRRVGPHNREQEVVTGEKQTPPLGVPSELLGEKALLVVLREPGQQTPSQLAHHSRLPLLLLFLLDLGFSPSPVDPWGRPSRPSSRPTRAPAHHPSTLEPLALPGVLTQRPLGPLETGQRTGPWPGQVASSACGPFALQTCFLQPPWAGLVLLIHPSSQISTCYSAFLLVFDHHPFWVVVLADLREHGLGVRLCMELHPGWGVGQELALSLGAVRTRTGRGRGRGTQWTVSLHRHVTTLCSL